MTDSVTKFPVTKKPKAEDEAREQVIGLLEEALGEATSGDITEILIILKHPDGTWSNRSSMTNSHSAWMGHLWQTLFDWSMEFNLNNRGLDPKNPAA